MKCNMRSPLASLPSLSNPPHPHPTPTRVALNSVRLVTLCKHTLNWLTAQQQQQQCARLCCKTCLQQTCTATYWDENIFNSWFPVEYTCELDKCICGDCVIYRKCIISNHEATLADFCCVSCFTVSDGALLANLTDGAQRCSNCPF